MTTKTMIMMIRVVNKDDDEDEVGAEAGSDQLINQTAPPSAILPLSRIRFIFCNML